MSAVNPMPDSGRQYAQIQALKAQVSVVEVDEQTFRAILRSREHSTIVSGRVGALWFKKHAYVTSYDGFMFVLRSDEPVDVAADAPAAFHIEAKTLNLLLL